MIHTLAPLLFLITIAVMVLDAVSPENKLWQPGDGHRARHAHTVKGHPHP